MGRLRAFCRAGHLPTLAAAFLYFDVSFMAWVLLGPLAAFIGEELRLTAAERGLLVAIPLLGGSLFRPLLGLLADLMGGRKTGLLGLVLTLLPLAAGWRLAGGLEHFYLVALLLGIAGASFAVALPLVSSWYGAEHQGLALGIVGAGNSGTLLATLLAPRLAETYGWRSVFGLAMIPVCAVAVVFALVAKESPKRPRSSVGRDYGAVLREPDALWFCLLYSLTFGGFVGLASSLPLFFHEQYRVSRVEAGDLATLVVVAGSLLRPVGGWLADRVGGYRLLLLLLSSAGCCMAGAGTLPPLGLALGLLIAVTGLLGMGNGAVFQLVPLRFPDRIGLVTGLVGAAGGLGGFLLPAGLGVVKERTGHYGLGLLLGAALMLAGALLLLRLGGRWRASWSAASVERAGIFGYRSLRSERVST
jgi:NNP family nitrate/nitrite transporter-like MFS transporter